MNKWVKRSLELVDSKGYLDKLQQIYPLGHNAPRAIDDALIKEISKKFKKKKKKELLQLLMQNGKKIKFPIENSYVSLLKANKNLLEKNPETVKKISKMVWGLGEENLLDLISSPKKQSRQYGHVFKAWLTARGYPFLNENDFDNTNGLAFLQGGDSTLKNYAVRKLGLPLTDLHKGIDFIFKKGNKICAGEAKFISAHGGEQTGQLNIALNIAKLRKPGVTSIAIIDGMPWFNKSYKKTILAHEDDNIFSALLLKDFINEL